MKIAIIFTHYGPYHIARVNALSATYKGEVIPIQLSRNEKIREWHNSEFQTKILTLQEGYLEDMLPSDLSNSMIRLLTKLQPDIAVVAGYSLSPMRSAAEWAQKDKKISILLSESHYSDRKRWLIKEKLKGWWIRRHFDATFVGGVRAAEYLESLGFPSDRIWRGYDVVDNAYFEQKSDEVRQKESEYRRKLKLPDKYFLYVGRFSPEKNLLRLLEAYRKYKDMANEKTWGLVMVGSGPQETELKKLAERLELYHIVWPGFKQIEELPIYYALASCFVLPSISEPWGLVVNEAMACGLPVLVSHRCGCVPELVHPGINGYMFDPFNIDEIAYYMTHISSGEVELKSMGEASKRIITNYTPEAWAKALKDCIEVTIERKSRK